MLGSLCFSIDRYDVESVGFDPSLESTISLRQIRGGALLEPEHSPYMTRDPELESLARLFSSF